MFSTLCPKLKRILLINCIKIYLNVPAGTKTFVREIAYHLLIIQKGIQKILYPQPVEFKESNSILEKAYNFPESTKLH